MTAGTVFSGWRAAAVLGLCIALLAAVPARAEEEDTAGEPVSVLEGQVMDPEGQPLEGATVYAVSDEARPRRRPRGPFAAMAGGDSGTEHAVTEAVTDYKGRFRIEAEGPAPFTLRAQAPGFAPAQTRKVHPGDMVTILVSPGWTLEGQVIDRKTGKPLAGAEVTARAQITDGFRDPEDPERFRLTATADDRGYFVIPDLAANFYRVTARSEGYAGESRSQVGVGLDGSTPEMMHLYLRPGVSVAGKITGTGGAVVSGATVRISPGGGIPSNLTAWIGSDGLYDSSDEEGLFEIRGAPRAESYTLTVNHEDHATAWLDDLRIEQGTRSKPIAVTLQEGSEVTGKLMLDDETPFTGEAELVLTYQEGRRGRRGGGFGPQTRRVSLSGEKLKLDKGKLLGKHLPAGEAELTLSAEGYAAIEKEKVIVPDDGPLELGTLLLDPGLGVAGVVVDDEGKPIPEASVAGTALYPGGFDRVEGTTDEKGRFRLGGLQENLPYSLRVSAKGYGSEAIEEAKPEGEDIEVVLQRAGNIRGRVVTGDPPRPIVGFTVEPHGKNDEGTPAMWRMAGLTSAPERFRDIDGVFELEDLAPGDYTLKVAAEGYIASRVEKIEVVPGETEDVGDVYIDKGATLRGFVLSADGEPVPGASVEMEDPSMFANAFVRMAQRGGNAGLVTRPDGGFTLTGLAPGRHGIKVNHENHAPGKAEIEIEAGVPPADVVVELASGGAVEGNIRDKSGEPMVGAMVMVMAGMSPDARSITSTDQFGYYRIEHIAPGSYRLMAMPQPTGGRGDQDAMLGGMQMASVAIKEGETSYLNLPQAENPINVRGVVRKGRLQLESRLFFTQISPDGTSAEQFVAGVTDVGGNFQVQLGAPGQYQVYVQPRGENRDMMMVPGTRLNIEVPEEAEVTIDLVIPEVRLAGTVIDGETGVPVPGARIIALKVLDDGTMPDRDDMVTSGETDENGQYSVEGFEPGTYQLFVSKAGYQETPLDPVEVDEDTEYDELDVVLQKGYPFTVRVVDESNVPIEGAFVMPLGFSLAWFGGSGGTTDVDGMLTVDGLLEGPHDLGAIARGFAPGVAEQVYVGPDGDRNVKIRLRRGGHLSLMVLDVDENPVAGATVHISEYEGPDLTRLFRLTSAFSGGSLSTGDDGTLDLSNLESGRYEVEVRLGDLRASELVRVKSGKKAELEIALR